MFEELKTTLKGVKRCKIFKMKSVVARGCSLQPNLDLYARSNSLKAGPSILSIVPDYQRNSSHFVSSLRYIHRWA